MTLSAFRRRSPPRLRPASSTGGRSPTAELYCEDCGFRAGALRFANAAALRRGCPCPRCLDDRRNVTPSSWLLVLSPCDGGAWTWSVRRNGKHDFGPTEKTGSMSYDAALQGATDELQRRGALNLSGPFPAPRLVVEPVGALPSRRSNRRHQTRKVATA